MPLCDACAVLEHRLRSLFICKVKIRLIPKRLFEPTKSGNGHRNAVLVSEVMNMSSRPIAWDGMEEALHGSVDLADFFDRRHVEDLSILCVAILAAALIVTTVALL